ncbi:MAG: hypothetical protein K6B67_02710 [Lachnospiraceae bacterium]|nr:hypothetical protein [Lachnospiraceae bacterium]
MGFKEKMARFFVGRNGADNLSKFTLAISMILMVITIITGNGIVYLLAIVALVYSYFRVMSKNVSKRYYENQQYLKATAGIRGTINGFLYKITKGNYHPNSNPQQFKADMERARRKAAYEREQRKMYKYFKCPGCKQKVRVPKGHGKIAITCPKCKMEFVRKS